MKVLLDTDIGSDIDDALALAYLLKHPDCELLGVTTVTGEPQKRAEMASAICRHAGRDEVPIHSGCPGALLIPMRQRHAPQAAALGNRPRRRDFAPCTAVEFLRQTIRANPGEITLLAVGPMTNVGLLFALDPGIPSMLRQLVLMCGRFCEPREQEWNAGGDPHATAIVYGAGGHTRSLRLVSLGLDVTRQCILPADEARRRFSAAVLEPVRDFAEVWFEQAPHVCFHDPLAAACIFEPELCTYAEGSVRLSLEEDTMGWTYFDAESKDKPHTIARSVDAKRFFDHYFSIIGY